MITHPEKPESQARPFCPKASPSVWAHPQRREVGQKEVPPAPSQSQTLTEVIGLNEHKAFTPCTLALSSQSTHMREKFPSKLLLSGTEVLLSRHHPTRGTIYILILQRKRSNMSQVTELMIQAGFLCASKFYGPHDPTTQVSHEEGD